MSTEYFIELAATIEHGRAILTERRRQKEEEEERQARLAEERRQAHLAKLPEWARAFAIAGNNYEDSIEVNLPGCTPICFMSTSWNPSFDAIWVRTPNEVQFRENGWQVTFDSQGIDVIGREANDMISEAVAIAAEHHRYMRVMQEEADYRNALPEDESPY